MSIDLDLIRLLSITKRFGSSRLSIEHDPFRSLSIGSLGQYLNSDLYIGHAYKHLTIPEHRGTPVANDSMCARTAAFAISFACATVALTGCASAPKGQSVA